jgi:hypothetical protein
VAHTGTDHCGTYHLLWPILVHTTCCSPYWYRPLWYIPPAVVHTGTDHCGTCHLLWSILVQTPVVHATCCGPYWYRPPGVVHTGIDHPPAVVILVQTTVVHTTTCCGLYWYIPLIRSNYYFKMICIVVSVTLLVKHTHTSKDAINIFISGRGQYTSYKYKSKHLSDYATLSKVA